MIAAIEANHPNLTNQKMLYVEISRARDRAELVTDDKAALKEQLEALTGERIAALEAVGEEKAKGQDEAVGRESGATKLSEIAPAREREADIATIGRERSGEKEFGL